MGTNNNIRSVSLYYQTAEQSGGNPGWAYNAIDSEGEHTSCGIQVTEDDDGGEGLTAVREAFVAAWPEAAEQLTKWTPAPGGGWRGTRY